jgi:hypothetical protein
VLAQVHSDHGLDATRQTVGFELDSGTVGKDLEAAVFDPLVNLAVNLAGMAAMIFVPGSASLVMPALVAYNAAQTVDQLHTEWIEGTLTAKDLTLGLTSIGLDLLPYVGRARALAGSRRALVMLEGVDLAGEAVYMTASALDQAQQLQAQQVGAMAGLYKQLVDLQATTHASDPRLLAIQAEFEQRAERVRGATIEAFAGMVKQRAIFLGAKHVFHGLQQAGAAGPPVSAASRPPATPHTPAVPGTPDETAPGARPPATGEPTRSATTAPSTGGTSAAVTPGTAPAARVPVDLEAVRAWARKLQDSNPATMTPDEIAHLVDQAGGEDLAADVAGGDLDRAVVRERLGPGHGGPDAVDEVERRLGVPAVGPAPVRDDDDVGDPARRPPIPAVRQVEDVAPDDRHADLVPVRPGVVVGGLRHLQRAARVERHVTVEQPVEQGSGLVALVRDEAVDRHRGVHDHFAHAALLCIECPRLAP